ncbi:MAG: ATP-binding protein [Paludibacteraceae bacterium]|nr:ATP-binding protein [Paludibacteraceae bacterium]
MIQRNLQSVLTGFIGKGKALLLIGARQVGKSTLFKQITDTLADEVLWLNCDQEEARSVLSDQSLNTLKLLLGDYKVIVIDEAQRVTNIGLTLKLITDNFPDKQLLVTGSSSLDLHNHLNEPLTGRKLEYYLYPISVSEIYKNKGLIATKELLPHQLIYGTYPDVLFSSLPPEKTLQELTDSYLYKDILEIEGIRKSAVLSKLLVALAMQIGSEVSYNELAKTVGIDSKTVEKYIDILEKCFIVFRLSSFSRNIRTELNKSKKIYFYDLGIRNAVLNMFAPIDYRQDIGALWENFFIVERLKFNHYADRVVNTYFWRTTEKQEIDYIEERNGELHLFELKWNVNKKNTKFPNQFIQTYQPNSTVVVTPENYLEFLI